MENMKFVSRNCEFGARNITQIPCGRNKDVYNGEMQKDEKGTRYVNLTYGTYLSVISNKNTWLAGKKCTCALPVILGLCPKMNLPQGVFICMIILNRSDWVTGRYHRWLPAGKAADTNYIRLMGEFIQPLSRGIIYLYNTELNYLSLLQG